MRIFGAAVIEINSPMVGGVEASDGNWVEGKQMLGVGQSVFYDAVALYRLMAQPS